MKRRIFLFSAVAGSVFRPLSARAEEKPAGEPRGESGVIEGVITEKGENWIRVRPAKGESMRFMPRWIGGMPADGGGLDRDMLEVFRSLKVNERVRVEWKFDERPRAIKVTRLEGRDGEGKQAPEAE